MRKISFRMSVFALGILITAASASVLADGATVTAHVAQKKKTVKIHTQRDPGYRNCLSIKEGDYDYIITGLSIKCDEDSKLKVSAKERKTVVINKKRSVDKYSYDNDRYHHFLFLEEEGFQPGDLITVRAYHKINGVFDNVPYAAKTYQFAAIKTVSKSQARKYYRYFQRNINRLPIPEEDPDLPGYEFGKFHQFYNWSDWKAIKGHREVGDGYEKADKIMGPAYMSDRKEYINRYKKYYKVTYTNDGRQPTYHSKELKRGMWYSADRYKPLCVYVYQRKTKRLVGVGYYGLRMKTYPTRLK